MSWPAGALRGGPVCGTLRPMGGWASMVRFALAAMVAAPATAQPVPAYSLETISNVPTARLAEQLLGREAAADVQSHEVFDGGLVEVLLGVRFEHRPRPVSAELCGRQVDYVAFSPVGTVAPDSVPQQRVAEPGRVVQRTEIALAPDCRLAPGQSFAIPHGVSREAAADALRAVIAARAAARGAGALAFSFTCADELGQGACGDDGRAALAGLRTEQAWLIEPVPGRPGQVRVVVGEPGQVFWELRFAAGQTELTDLAMTRKVPAPF